MTHDPSDPLKCTTDNSTDYYGLGVRLGIYFSWLASYLANAFLPSAFSGAADTSTIFLLTLLVAMTNDSRTGDLTQIDGLTLMHLCGGTTFGVLSLWGYRTSVYHQLGPRAVRRFGGLGTHIRLAVSLGASVYELWFWLYGVRGGLDGLEGECAELWTWFFVRLYVNGGIRWYYVVVCAACAAWFGCMLVVAVVAGVASFELSWMFQTLRVGALVWLVWSAVTAEVTLNLNHVSGVLDGRHDGELQLPGQFLPFLVGLFSFIRTCYQLLTEKLGAVEEQEKKTPETGPAVIVMAKDYSPARMDEAGTQ
ncbi:hypothetical protein OQA88_5506 [Cercophora sp. LCS_1]